MNRLAQYMDDPEIAGEPALLREVHAARLMIHDETKAMSESELIAYYQKATERARKEYGIEVVHPDRFGKRKAV